ncbi:MAG: hypothetical protein JW807_14665 [Spirochaetes bacterium]|nr:hypothetical protein [Spirochaetota bacterium]
MKNFLIFSISFMVLRIVPFLTLVPRFIEMKVELQPLTVVSETPSGSSARTMCGTHAS